MMKLLKLEYYKNLNYTPFKIFTLLYFAILIGFLFIGLADIKLFGETINLKEQGMYNYPEIWNFTTYTVATLKVFLGLIIVFSICQEFNDRMFKQNIIDGLSREEFILSKFLTITIFTVVSTILVFLITIYLGNTYSNNTDPKMIYKEVFFIGNYFIKLFTFFSFLLFLSILLRKSVFVFLAFFVIWVAEVSFSVIERHQKLFGIVDNATRTKILNEEFFYTRLLPLESMANLIPNPIMRLNMAKVFGLKYEFTYPTDCLIACLIWCIIFIGGSYLILKKRDW